jgi:hypothetical protein
MEAAHGCFAGHWLALAFGRTLGPADQCLLFAVTRAFAQSGHDVRKLLLAVTQTDAFLSPAGQGK